MTRRLDKWWDSVPKRRKQVLRCAIEREKRAAERWLKTAVSEWGVARYGRIPTERDGESANIRRYEYSTASTDPPEDMGDRLDDRDGVDFSATVDTAVPVAEETPEHREARSLSEEEAARHYLGLTSTLDKETLVADESSGTLGSSWSRVERNSIYYKDGRRKNPPTAKTAYPENYTPTRVETVMVPDPNWSNGDPFHPAKFVHFNPYDPDNQGLKNERRVMYNKSPRRDGDVVPDTNYFVMSQKPATYPTGPVRDWKPTAKTVAAKVNDPRYQKWLWSGNYEGWVQYHDWVESATAQTEDALRRRKEKNGRTFLVPPKKSPKKVPLMTSFQSADSKAS